MNSKFELVKKGENISSKKSFYQIRALRDIKNLSDNGDILVKKGSLGGYVQDEKSLNANDESWIDKGVFVDADSFITEDSRVMVKSSEKAAEKNKLQIINSIINNFSFIVNDSINDVIIKSSKIGGSCVLSSNIKCAEITNSFVGRTDVIFPFSPQTFSLADGSFLVTNADMIIFENLIMTHTMGGEILISCPLFNGKISDFLNHFTKELLAFLGYDNLILNKAKYKNKNCLFLNAKREIEKKLIKE